eukprot:GILK01007518.1.p1 GENE.GILK01007518.1~~GILK01007518.1.p1  ORF type:complete len:923 (-),score=202.67 GILK01007518.1:113-2881(-)
MSKTVLDVHKADTGETYRIEGLDQQTIVDSLKQALAAATGIGLQDQILLSGDGLKLDGNRPLDTYDVLTQGGKKVFLFDRKSLSSSVPTPLLTPLQPLDISDAELQFETPSLDVPMDLSSSQIYLSSPLLKALPDYERAFHTDVQEGKSMLRQCEGLLRACKQSLMEEKVQQLAMDAVMKNLQRHNETTEISFKEFQKKFLAQDTRHTTILSTFQEDLENLRKVPLHPALQTPSRQTLQDCIAIDKFIRWANECKHAQESLQNKVLTLTSLSDAIRCGVSAEEERKLVINYEVLNGRISAAEQQCRSARARVKELIQEHTMVRETIQNTLSALSTGRGATIKPLEVCQRLEDMKSLHATNQFAQLKQHFEFIQSVANACTDSKAIVTKSMHERLQAVSYVQSKIRDLGNKMTLLAEALSRQDSKFSDLTHIHKLHRAYKACLTEVSRRRAFKKMYMTHAQAFAERMAKVREKEEQTRERFLRKYGRHLPKDFVPGLNERPPYCEIRAGDFDDQLPAIDITQSSVEASTTGAESQSGSLGAEGPLLLPADPSWMVSAGASIERCQVLEAENQLLAAMLAQQRHSSVDSDSTQQESNQKGDSRKSSSSDLTSMSPTAVTSNNNATVEALLQRLKVYERRIADLEKTNQTLTERIILKGDNTRQQINSSSPNSSNGNDINININENNNNSNNKNSEVEKERDRLMLELDSIKNQVSEKEEEIQKYQSSCIDLENRYLESIKQIDQLKGEVETFYIWKDKLISVMPHIQNRKRISADTAIDKGDRVEHQVSSDSQFDSILEQFGKHVKRKAELEKELGHWKTVCERLKAVSSKKISCTRFEVDDIALFFPTPRGDYLAFNRGCPHRYLSAESVQTFLQQHEFSRDYILGQIVEMNSFRASEEPGRNPFNLVVGTEFYVLTVTSWSG